MFVSTTNLLIFVNGTIVFNLPVSEWLLQSNILHKNISKESEIISESPFCVNFESIKGQELGRTSFSFATLLVRWKALKISHCEKKSFFSYPSVNVLSTNKKEIETVNQISKMKLFCLNKKKNLHLRCLVHSG